VVRHARGNRHQRLDLGCRRARGDELDGLQRAPGSQQFNPGSLARRSKLR
jgi:hypothetical protein